MLRMQGWYHGLYRRIALGSAGLVALILVAQATAFGLLGVTSTNSFDDVREQGLAWTRGIAVDLGRALEESSTVDLAERLERIDLTRRVFVILRDGRLIGSAPEELVTSTVTTDFALVPREGPLPATWERGVYGGAALRVRGEVVGVVGIRPRTMLQRYGPLIATGGTLLLATAIVIFSIVVVGPVRTRLINLQLAARKLGRGELDTRVAIEGSDEVSEVARAFNSMADDLQQRTTALETSDRLRRQLVADVSHELMTPLTAVLGHLETLDMDEVRLDDGERRRQLAIARREARRLQRIIGDLLATARYEAGGGELECEEISTSDLFTLIVGRHEYECRKRRLTLDMVIAPDAATFEADPFRIEQAIENIVANALRHTPDGGRISLSAARNGGNIVIEVSDSGEGIPDEHLPHVFDRFYKASSSKGIASPGSGLGLSIVKAIVNRHRGQVGATSAPGIGTIVRMEFPIATPVSETHAPASASRLP